MKKDLQINYGGKEEPTIYRVIGNCRSFCLTGSPLDSSWRQHDKEYLRLTEHDNGLTIQFSDSPKPTELNYLQAEQLRLALKINNPKPTVSEIQIRKFKGLE